MDEFIDQTLDGLTHGHVLFLRKLLVQIFIFYFYGVNICGKKRRIAGLNVYTLLQTSGVAVAQEGERIGW